MPVDILVVDDNASERACIVDALSVALTNMHIVAVDNGIQAMDFLLARGAWPQRTDELPPRLILLDLKMPGLDGFAVLEQIRGIRPFGACTSTPVVVFSDSESVEDIERSYRCGANSYVFKPLGFPEFKIVLERVGNYWMKLNRCLT